MSYEPYADTEYYLHEYEGDIIPEDKLKKQLKTASRHMDTLTYNRIVGKGISNMSQWQQDIIREVCCEMADFEYENADMIQSVLQSYSINGVSMQFGSNWNVTVQDGIAIRRDTYAKLQQTGLTSRIIGR